MKKLFAFLMAAMLVASMTIIPASAAGTYTIKINSDHSTHTYTAYRIFTGKLDGSVLSDLTWGEGVTTAGQTALQEFYNKSNASGVAGTLSETTVAAFADNVAQYLDETHGIAGTYNSEDEQYIIDNLEAGYYLVKETTGSTDMDGSEHAYSKYILRIINNVELSPKSGVPTLTKEVKLGETGTYKEAISATVGDTVYFRLTASLHTYVHDYNKYYFRFEDQLPAGLTFNDVTVSVQSGFQTYPVTGFSVDTTGPVTVTIQDVHATIRAATGASTVISDKIIVELKTTANSNLVLGSAGNINTAKLYFSNNPNENYTGTGEPDSLGATGEGKAKAIVYSYQIELTKVDAADSNAKLEGAEFIVGYKNGDGTYTWFTADSNGVINGTTASEDGAARFITNDQGLATIPGLASGTYHIREKRAPAQYNLMTSDIIVQFAGSLSQDTGTINALTISSVSGVSSSSTDLATGTIRLTATNTKGAVLPETGGIGTTIFYVVGIALMLGAVAVIVAKKRSGETK